MRRLSGLLRFAGRALLAAGWAWAGLALFYFPDWGGGIRGAAVAVWLMGSVVLWRRLSSPRREAALALGVAAVALVFLATVRPRLDRGWTPDEARMPVIRFAPGGERVTIENLRHATYRTTADYDVEWYARTFDLARLSTLDFVVEPFASWRGPAHTFLTFGFADGEHVAVSVEIRKEKGESFSPWAGLFRHYEILYVLGDERDLIGLRANVRHDPVYVYPIHATPEQIRALFRSMLRRAQGLAVHPEFYNTLTSTCTTNIVRHVNELRDHPIPWWDGRVILPGYSDELAFERGLIDFPGTLDQARRRFQINRRSAFGADGPTWSRQIRRVGGS